MNIYINKDIDKNRLLDISFDMINHGTIELYTEDENLFKVEITEHDILYHGTSEKIGRIIEEIGYICNSSVSGINTIFDLKDIANEGKIYYKDRIFLTTKYESALEWAKYISEHDGSSPVVFKVLGYDIIDSKCKAVIDVLVDQKVPISSIALIGCSCIKASIIK